MGGLRCEKWRRNGGPPAHSEGQEDSLSPFEPCLQASLMPALPLFTQGPLVGFELCGDRLGDTRGDDRGSLALWVLVFASHPGAV